MSSFRFPRGTIVLMLIILFGVVHAIERGHALSIQLASGASVPSVWWPGLFMRLFMLMGGLSILGYGVLLLLGKAGVQRFTSIQTWPSGK